MSVTGLAFSLVFFLFGIVPRYCCCKWSKRTHP